MLGRSFRTTTRAGPTALLGGLILVSSSSFRASGAESIQTNNFIRGVGWVINDNGAWSWFMDERAIVDRDKILVGSVRANGRFEQSDRPGWGNVELSVLDPNSGASTNIVLHSHFEQDDHNSPALYVRRDGRYLAIYSKHNQEPKIYWRISLEPGNALSWGPIHEFETPGGKGRNNATYCNPFRLSSEDNRLYLFHRGYGLDPNYLVSDDDGETWRYGGHLFVGRGGYAPYTKYASNGKDTIHFVATEDHPRNYDNSLYHGMVRGGQILGSDGTKLASLAQGTNATLKAWELTRVYQGGPTNVAWMCDLALDAAERPVVLFTTQRDGKGLPMGSGGLDHRFHYGLWDGSHWQVHEIAYAGTRLYPGEDDYTGLGSIDPKHPDIVYISTDANPSTGAPLISKANFRRHHELFRGVTTDSGATWNWVPITRNSTTDNLRPLVPSWNDSAGRTVVIWMRGAYRVNRGEWGTEVWCTLLNARDFQTQ
jgi:hypothetical protein